VKNEAFGACAVIVCSVILPALFYVVAVWAQGFNLPDAVGLLLLIIAGVLLMIAFLALAAAESIPINGGTVVSGGALAAGQTAATPGTV
jgi:hypothetical protein